MNLTRRDALLGLTAVPLSLPFSSASFSQSPRTAKLRPGDDFYRYVNATDLDSMSIPAGYWDYGQFDIVAKRVNDQIRTLVLAAAENSETPAEQRVAAVYRSLLDEAAIERTGVPRLEHELAWILSARTHEDLGRVMAHPRSSTPVAFNVFPAQGEWMLHLDQQNQNQPMLGLGSRDYEGTDAHAVRLRDAYRVSIAQLFDLASVPDSDRRAADVVAIEKEIARREWEFERLRDRRANLHVMSREELAAYAPGFPWRKMLGARGVAKVAKINLGTDSAVAAQARLFRETPVDAWRSWLAFSWIRNGIDVMPARMRDAWWRFSGEVARDGAPRPSREDEAVRFVTKRMPMDVGRLYAQAAFPEANRQKAEQLLVYLKHAMAERLRDTEWLDPASRSEALAKLDAMVLKSGYPLIWPQPEAVTIKADDAAGNLGALLHRDWSQQVARLTSAAARREPWYQSPIAVNASYSVLFNSIEAPAAILQPPFFSADAHPAANFGAIGAILGHEMGHAFDDQGLLFDSKGILRDWMTTDAKAAFSARAERLVAQYGGFEALPGLKLNGRRTLGENIADLSGLSLALRAYQLFRQDQGHLNGDDTEGARMLFRSWAKVWCYNGPESAIRFIVANSYHVPAAFRVNGAVRNVDAWYNAFGVGPGDALYLPPEERVHLW